MRLKNLFSLFALCFLIISFQHCSNSSDADTAQSDTVDTQESGYVQQTVQPPLEHIDVPFKKFSVEPTKESTLNLDNGSSIEITADAFVDFDGKTITSTVEI